MAGGYKIDAVRKLIEPIAESLGLTLWDVKAVKESTTLYLRVFIDRDGGVTIDDCEAMSKAIDAPLDELDPIPDPYILEVSSPGLERDLTYDWHFEQFTGEEIVVKLFKAVNGKKEFIGTLSSCKDGNITIASDGNEFTFSRKEISTVRSYFEF